MTPNLSMRIVTPKWTSRISSRTAIQRLLDDIATASSICHWGSDDAPSKRRAAETQELLPSEPHLSFAGHETFVFRYAWLTKAVEAVQTDSQIFSRDDAIVLGVGKNMVRSIRHWGLATEVLQEEPKPRKYSECFRVGQFLCWAQVRLDRYPQDQATLWLFHWQLVSNRTDRRRRIGPSPRFHRMSSHEPLSRTPSQTLPSVQVTSRLGIVCSQRC